jgi:hypothetical protein
LKKVKEFYEKYFLNEKVEISSTPEESSTPSAE